MKNYFLRKFRQIIGTERNAVRLQSILDQLEMQDRRILEIHYANLFNSSISGSKWLRQQAFSPGGWAVGYAFLYVLYRILDDMQPKKVVEFGLGQSTRMLMQYSDYFKAEVHTFEHDMHWLHFFKAKFEKTDDSRIHHVQAELVEFKGFKTLRYKENVEQITGGDIELILLDGPNGSERYSRIQILDLIPQSINKDNFCIIIDDFQRIGEKDTERIVCKSFYENNIPFKKGVYKDQKELMIICSPNNEFLSWL